MNRSTVTCPSLQVLNRRNLLQTGTAALVTGSLVQTTQAVAHTNQSDDQTVSGEAKTADRVAVLAAGMTEQEADCWEWTAKAAGAFFELPELHPMDASEVASAIHIIQNKLLSRPTYRNYLAAHKANAEANAAKVEKQ